MIPARPLTIVGLGGSLGTSSSSLAALSAALDGAKAQGANVRAFDLRTLDLPMFDPNATHVPAAAQELADAVHAADGLVWASPMYHGTVSGAFKNALDWLQVLSNRTPAYLTNKPVGLISTAAGVQGLQAINTMEFVVRALRGWTVPLTVPIARIHQVFAPDGHILDEAVAKQLASLGREVVLAARRFSFEPPQPQPSVVLATGELLAR